MSFDAAPTAGSTNPVTSGGVKTELDKKADGADLRAHLTDQENPHKVTAAQAGAVPATEKGAAGGVATLGEDGKVPAGQLPAMDYAAKTHAATHASGGSDPITPASIGAAPAYAYGTADLTAGTSALATGQLYFVYE